MREKTPHSAASGKPRAADDAPRPEQAAPPAGNRPDHIKPGQRDQHPPGKENRQARKRQGSERG